VESGRKRRLNDEPWIHGTAAVIAAAANVLFVWWLMAGDVCPLVLPLEEEDALQVHWVVRERPEPPLRQEKLPQRRALPPPAAKTDSPRPEVSPPSLVVPEVPLPPGTQHAPRQLDLGIKEEDTQAGEPFRPSLTKRREPDAFMRDPVLHVEMQDRSLGGRLQRMSAQAVCAELRQAATDALRAGTGSRLDLIAKIMHERGCR
jgi:hypothetical protein